MPAPMNRAAFGLIALVASLAAPAALACNVSTSVLSFGAINPLLDGQRDSTASIVITCPAPTPYTVTLSPGSGTYSQRTLLSGSLVLNYNLYLDSQRTQIWGDGSGMTMTATGSADSNGTTHTVYGSVPAQPGVAPGVYSDSIIITVNY